MAVDDDSGALWAAVHEAVREHLAACDLEHLAPLGVEYVEALRSGANLRELAEAQPSSELRSGRVVVSPLFEASDRDLRRAVQIAKAIWLNERRKAGKRDVFADLDAAERPVSLDARRNKRTKGGAA